VECNKPIVVLRHGDYNITEEDIPKDWKRFSSLLTGPRTLVYIPTYITQCAQKLQNIRKNVNNKLKHYDTTDEGVK
jgi:hypothetical protein